MTTTTNLGLPTWDEGNTEPNLVFNQLLAASDALVQCVVQAITSTPPTTPTLGLGWIIGASPTGAWAGRANQIAVAVTGGWKYYLPENGWAAFVVSEGGDYQLVSGTWDPRGSGGGFTNPMTDLGDMIYGGAAGLPTRVPAGTLGQAPRVQADGSIAFQSDGAVAAPPVTALSISSGVVDVDLADGDYFTLDLTANVLSITFSHLPGSGYAKTFALRLKQDSTGGRTVAFPSSFKSTVGSDVAVQSGSNAYTLLVATSFDQGTRWEYSMKGIAT